MSDVVESGAARRGARLRCGVWMAEAAAVFLFLAVWAARSDRPLRGACVALAVTLSFLHAQGAASAGEASRESPPREASSVPFMRAYYVGREVAWGLYFISDGSWGAILGCAVFLAYPTWRSWVRGRLRKAR